MDAAALANLPRSELVQLARTNEIDPELNNEEIIVALLTRFPLGVVPYLVHSRRNSSISRFVGRFRNALKTVRLGSRIKSTPLESEPMSMAASVEAVYDNQSVRDDGWSTSAEISHAIPTIVEDDANPEDVQRLMAQMVKLSAQNKSYLARAAAVKAEADRLNKLAAETKRQLIVEQTRRQRVEDYYKYWRAMDAEWSHTAIWDSQITVVPVTARIPGVKGSYVIEMEVTESDDERLQKQWTYHHKYFKRRRREARGRKAEQRNIPVDMVSDVETASDEEEFRHPFVLTDADGDQGVSDSERYVYPMMNEGEGMYLFPPETIVIKQHGSRKRRLEDGEGRQEKRARRTQESVTIQGLREGETELDRDVRILDALNVDERHELRATGLERVGGWFIGSREQ